MILFYDTETTGLPVWQEPSDHPSQPHIVQLALLLAEDDGTEIESHNAIVRPDGWIISDEVSAIHGITQERALADGIPESIAVNLYVTAMMRCSMRVAHNQSFDERIVRIAMLRAGILRRFIEFLETAPSSCTCTDTTALVNLPPSEKMAAKGMKRPKPPKLIEATRFFFNEDLPGAHDAMVDVRACARIFFHLKTLGEAA